MSTVSIYFTNSGSLVISLSYSSASGGSYGPFNVAPGGMLNKNFKIGEVYNLTYTCGTIATSVGRTFDSDETVDLNKFFPVKPTVPISFTNSGNQVISVSYSSSSGGSFGPFSVASGKTLNKDFMIGELYNLVYTCGTASKSESRTFNSSETIDLNKFFPAMPTVPIYFTNSGSLVISVSYSSASGGSFGPFTVASGGMLKKDLTIGEVYNLTYTRGTDENSEGRTFNSNETVDLNKFFPA